MKMKKEMKIKNVNRNEYDLFLNLNRIQNLKML
jgi:hypothetical protein